MFNFLSASLLALSWLLGCHGYRVLLLPLPMKSHIFSFHVIGKELERRGHEVHVILDKAYKVPKAFAENTSVVYHIFGEDKQLFDSNFYEITSKFVNELIVNDQSIKFIKDKAYEFNQMLSQDLLMNSEKMFTKLEKMKYDAIVVDILFFMKFSVLIAHRLKLPLVVYSNTHNPWIIRTPWLPSFYSTSLDSVEEADSFFKRTSNLLMSLLDKAMPLNPPLDEEVLKKFRKYGYFEDEDDLIRNASLFLWPEDPVFSPMPPMTTNMIPIGGLTIDFTSMTDTKSGLPKEFKDFIEVPDSKGTIVVSFGSSMSSYPEKTARLFTETFRLFQQYRFIWRYDNEHSLALSPNVKISNWLPQKELLGHPSVELFITHAGNNGLFEAIHSGIPMLAVPLFGDQHSNARKTTKKGYGEMVALQTATVEILAEKIKMILNDPAYKGRIVKASKIIRSQKETPAQRASNWIEHIIEFGGEHLRPIGNKLHPLQYLCLDVILFLQICIVVVVVAFWWLIRKLLGIFGLTTSIKHKQL